MPDPLARTHISQINKISKSNQDPLYAYSVAKNSKKRRDKKHSSCSFRNAKRTGSSFRAYEAIKGVTRDTNKKNVKRNKSIGTKHKEFLIKACGCNANIGWCKENVDFSRRDEIIEDNRSRSSCENCIKNGSRNEWKGSSGTRKLAQVTNSNRYSGRFGREVPYYGTNRSSTRGQNHSMYCLSNIGNYIPLSANVRESNQSEDPQRLFSEPVKEASPREIRKKRGINEDINLKIAFQECTKPEAHFFNWVLPLIQGAAMYKKFSTNHLLQQKVFDPLNGQSCTPDMWGYGVRSFRLDPSLTHIEVRQHLKSSIEFTINVEDIIKPIIPHTTIDIIKFQNYELNSDEHSSQRNNQIFEDFSIFHLNSNISNLVKAGIINKNSDLYRQKWLESTYYPFSIVLANERIELVATTYEILNHWVIGLNLLVDFKKHLPRLRTLIDWETAE